MPNVALETAELRSGSSTEAAAWWLHIRYVHQRWLLLSGTRVWLLARHYKCCIRYIFNLHTNTWLVRFHTREHYTNTNTNTPLTSYKCRTIVACHRISGLIKLWRPHARYRFRS